MFQRLVSALCLYLVAMGALIYFKPQLIFTEYGTFKEFGFGNDKRKTVFPLWFLSIAMGILSYFLVFLIEFVRPSIMTWRPRLPAWPGSAPHGHGVVAGTGAGTMATVRIPVQDLQSLLSAPVLNERLRATLAGGASFH